MTTEEIICMAREVGGADISMNGWTSWVGTQSTEFLERFAALVASVERERLTDAAMKAAEKAVDVAIALEREACALKAEEFLTEPEPDWDGDFWNQAIERVALAIRARGQA